MNNMRTFNDREKAIIGHLLRAADDTQPLLINKALETFFFKEEYGRALIIQNQGEYAVFFLKTECFDNKEKRDEEVKRFLELLALLNHLDKKGYITIYRHVTEKLYYVQDYFDAPRVTNNTLFLNTKGYYSPAPDTIYDSNKNVIYRGVIFRDYHYRLILSAAVGSLLLSESLSGLLNEDDNPLETPLFQNINREEFINKNKEKMNDLNAPHPNERLATTPPAKKRKPVFQYLHGVFTLLMFSATTLASYLFHDRMETHEQHLTHLNANHQALSDSLIATNARINHPAFPPQTPIADKDRSYYGVDLSKIDREVVTEITLKDSITLIVYKATEGATCPAEDEE
jgi:hypothetical protein